MKLRPSFPVEFYVSDVGYMVFKGQNMNSYPDDEEAVFYMSPDQVALFAFHFQNLMAEQKAKWTGVEDDV